jgi:2-hydroxyacyl-CoA lyase 1
MMLEKTVPMNYYSVFKIIEEHIQKLKEDYYLVSEGSNTMDIGRTILSNTNPR